MRYQRTRRWQWLIWVSILLVVLALMTFGNLRYAEQNPGGNDFLVHWVGTRSLVIEGLSPYSDETALQIQQYAYGRPARPGEHELRVAYPLYSIVVFLPYAFVSDFTLARALWMTTLEAALLLLAFISIRLTGWRPKLISIAVFLLFSILWYHAMRPLINGNAVILVALFIAGGLLALREGADELAGVLFAFSTIKPQVVVLFIGFIFIWGIRKQKWQMVGWMAGTIFLLSLSVGLLIPDWILQNLREILRYPGYNPPGTLQAALKIWSPEMGSRLGWAITGILSVIMLVEWWFADRWSFRGVLWVSCLTLVVSQWIGIQTDPGNFIVLYPALLLVFAVWEERWRKSGAGLSMVSMIILFIGIWGIFLATVQYGDQPQQSPVMFLPLPAFLFLSLYWVRWWAIGPPNLWFDQIYSQENLRSG